MEASIRLGKLKDFPKRPWRTYHCWLSARDALDPAGHDVGSEHWPDCRIRSPRWSKLLLRGVQVRITAKLPQTGWLSEFFDSRVGVPQVVLPQWLDTYDCATRVEWLGIGINGSRTSAPGIDATEFAKALIQVLRDANMRLKSNTMKNLCSKTEGRVMAHDQIVDFCSMEYSRSTR